MNNFEVKEMIRKSRFRNYEIAEKMGMREESFSRIFRKPLSEQQIERIQNAITELRKEYI